MPEPGLSKILKATKLHKNHKHTGEQLTKTAPHSREAAKFLVSPLGWSITGRLLVVAAAALFLWLAVAWAIGWLP